MGKLFVVGIGPGDPDGMTIAARRALEAADIVVGYTKYVELALAAVPDAAHLATPMMHEVERCRLALSRAQSGEAVALVCSGDAGVYGMASPVLELAEDYPDVDVEVIAGATAAQSVSGAFHSSIIFAAREGQQSGMCRLSELGEIDADMFTTVFVGNADTKLVGGRMVTPRGYREIPCER